MVCGESLKQRGSASCAKYQECGKFCPPEEEDREQASSGPTAVD